MTRAWCIVLGLMLWPVLARAEWALILPLRSEVALAPEERAAAHEALAGALAAEGLEPAVDSSSEPCVDTPCVAARLASVSATHAIELKLWRAADGLLSGVSVSIVEPAGERFSEGAQIGSRGLHAAVAQATHGAIERMRRGPGPWLEVSGSPEGAAIAIDGEAAGALPRRIKVTGGLHRVTVSSPGYEPLEQTVTVPRNPDALKHVDVSLSAAPAGNHLSVKASSWNYVIAAVAIAAGAVLSVGPVQTAARDGECGRKESGICTGVVAFDAGEGLQVAAAGLLVGGGIAFGIWAPITVRAGDEGALLVTSGHF